PPRRQLLGGRHPQLVALLLGGVPDAPGRAPVGEAVEQALPLCKGEHLGVAHLVDAPVAWQHDSTDAQRTGPRPTPHLVDADDDVVPAIPQLALDTEARDLALG